MNKIILLIVAFSCAINLNAQVDADFNADRTIACPEVAINFTDNSTGTITSWFWDFGDGTTSTLQNPVKSYITGGMYTVILTISDGVNSDTRTRVDYIRVLDFDALFTLNPSMGCALPHVVFFTDQSQNPDTWNWNFGDGGASNVRNPIHSYSSSGDFVVVLTVTDTIFGCIDTYQEMVNISVVDADFTSQGAIMGVNENQFGCAPLTVNYEDLSTGDIASWAWDFGDGTTSSEQNPVHVYGNVGIYDVSLSVTANNGCVDVRERPFYVQTIGLDVNFGADTLMGEAEFMVSFTDSTLFSAPIVAWMWDFGDGGTSNLRNPTYIFTDEGDYDVSLTISDIDGCSRTFTRPNYIAVAAMPAAVPTMSTWGLIIIGLLFLIISMSMAKTRIIEISGVEN